MGELVLDLLRLLDSSTFTSERTQLQSRRLTLLLRRDFLIGALPLPRGLDCVWVLLLAAATIVEKCSSGSSRLNTGI